MTLPAIVGNGPAYRYAATVTRVIDGDTVKADVDLGFFTWVRGVSLRFLSVDCPERGEAGWAEATAFTKDMIVASNQQVIIDTVKPDKYGGRWDVMIYLTDGPNAGRELGSLLIENGHVKRLRMPVGRIREPIAQHQGE